MNVSKYLIVSETGLCRLVTNLPRLKTSEQAIKLNINIPRRKAPPMVEILVEMPEWPSATYEVSVGDET